MNQPTRRELNKKATDEIRGRLDSVVGSSLSGDELRSEQLKLAYVLRDIDKLFAWGNIKYNKKKKEIKAHLYHFNSQA